MDKISSIPNISVVVPVYNSRGSLEELTKRLDVQFRKMGQGFELILVNDFSGDGSDQKIDELAKAHHWIKAIHLRKNFGQHNALLCGIRAARGRFVVTLDDDLQNPPECIPKMFEKISSTDLDLVYGSYFVHQHQLWRQFASKLTKWVLAHAMGVSYAGNFSTFRIFKRDLATSFESFDSPIVSIDVLLSWVTSRVGFVEVEHHPRLVGESNYTLFKLIKYTINLVTGFSDLPLRMASLIGMAFTCFGGLLMGFILIRYFINGGKVPGFTFLAASLSIFSGVQLFCFGVFGEYLARVHLNSTKKPQYSIRPSPDAVSFMKESA